jgi:magnesium-transporting ATPase (P-type)
VVLVDDHFATLVRAIEEGRAIHGGIRKFLAYVLSSNVPELVPYLAMAGLGIPPALTVLQVLAVDLGTDMAPAVALGAEPPERDAMARPPRPRTARLLDARLLWRAYGFLGVLEAAAAMGGFALVLGGAGLSLAELRGLTPALLDGSAPPAALALYRRATTVALLSVVACQVGNLFNCRSERASVFARGRPPNPLLGPGLAVEAGVVLLVLLVPPLALAFGTAPPRGPEWAWIAAWPPAMVAAEEARKAWLRRRACPPHP